MLLREKKRNGGHYTCHTTIYLLTITLITTSVAYTSKGDLQADAGGPYFGMINVSVSLIGSAAGGNPPYEFSWDIDNDTIFDDAMGSNVSWIWNKTGIYPITLRVIDATLNESFDTTNITIFDHPLSADAGGPYTGSVNAIITFTGTATGGLKPYMFYWEFTNDSLYDDATGANCTFCWNARGIYPISLKVIDSIGNQAIDNSTITILGASVNIQKPLPNTMYLWNIPIPRIKSSLIIGPCALSVQIESDILCNLSICINNEEVHTEHNLIGTHYIQTKYTSVCFGMRRISASVTDSNGQEYIAAVSVLILCCGRLLRL